MGTHEPDAAQCHGNQLLNLCVSSAVVSSLESQTFQTKPSEKRLLFCFFVLTSHLLSSLTRGFYSNRFAEMLCIMEASDLQMIKGQFSILIGLPLVSLFATDTVYQSFFLQTFYFINSVRPPKTDIY